MNPLHFAIGFALAVGLLLIVLELIRRRLLSERYSLIWLASAIVVILLMIFYESGYMRLVRYLRIANPPTLIFVICFFFLALIVLHYSLAITRLSNRSKETARQLALLDDKLAELSRKKSVCEKCGKPIEEDES